MLRSLLLASAFGLTATAAADARAEPTAASTVESFFENTLQVTYPDGRVVRYHFEPGGAFTATGGESGTWTLEGDELCLDRTLGEDSCAPIPPGKSVGDSWTSPDGAVRIDIVAGRDAQA